MVHLNHIAIYTSETNKPLPIRTPTVLVFIPISITPLCLHQPHLGYFAPFLVR